MASVVALVVPPREKSSARYSTPAYTAFAPPALTAYTKEPSRLPELEELDEELELEEELLELELEELELEALELDDELASSGSTSPPHAANSAVSKVANVLGKRCFFILLSLGFTSFGRVPLPGLGT